MKKEALEKILKDHVNDKYIIYTNVCRSRGLNGVDHFYYRNGEIYSETYKISEIEFINNDTISFHYYRMDKNEVREPIVGKIVYISIENITGIEVVSKGKAWFEN